MKKIYIGCSLTQAPEGFKASVALMKDALRAEFDILDFIGIADGTPTDVYRRDIEECLTKCDIFVAICDFPAIGLGYELGMALEKLEKPTLALAQTDIKVTRLLSGIDKPHFRFERYTTFDEIPDRIRNYSREMR